VNESLSDCAKSIGNLSARAPLKAQVVNLVSDGRHIRKRHTLSICFKKLGVGFLVAAQLINRRDRGSRPEKLGPLIESGFDTK
jgi:hypothetical protein